MHCSLDISATPTKSNTMAVHLLVDELKEIKALEPAKNHHHMIKTYASTIFLFLFKDRNW